MKTSPDQMEKLLRSYVESGFALVPIPRGSKAPNTKGWNKPEGAIKTEIMLHRITANVGLAHAYSTPVTCTIDIDDLVRATGMFLEHGINLTALLEADDAVQIISGKANRAKLLYRLPQNVLPLSTVQKEEGSVMVFELRCATKDGATVQDVLPPSVHPEMGCEYAWGGKGDYRELPTLPESLLTLWLEMAAPSRRGEDRSLESHVQANSRPEETPESVAKLKSVLSILSAAQPYPLWFRLVLSVKAHGFSGGETICREWCKSAGNYDRNTNPGGYDERVFNKVWSTEVRDISFRTVYHYASHPEGGDGRITSGDIKAGEVFAEMFLEKMKFVYPFGKWIVWSGGRWHQERGHEPLAAAKQTAAELVDRAEKAASTVSDDAIVKKMLSEARAFSNVRKLESMLKCAAAEPGMYIDDVTVLDRNIFHLGCENGVVDLTSGALLEGTPDLLITKSAGVQYDPEAVCPLWEKFLLEIMLGDAEMVEYLQRAVGYTLTGAVSEEVLHFAYGTGNNGKSVFANILTKLMGDYALTAPAEMLMKRDRGSSTANNDIARLVGVRLLMANETRASQVLDDLTLKSLVSTERISARFLYGEFFDFWPRLKIWVRGNHKPIIQDESDGAWRRLRLLEFALKLDECEIDRGLESALEKELPGILCWAVRGCLIWQKAYLSPPAKVEIAGKAYRRDSDILADFIEDRCVVLPEERVSQRDLFDEYKLWSVENGIRYCAKKSFTRMLLIRGFTSNVYIGNARAYGGLTLQSSRASPF
jgi:P4 family phage/plasmid primase-like protien